MTADLEARLRVVEAALGLSQSAGVKQHAEPSTSVFWAVDGLAERGIDGVLLAGRVNLPEVGPIVWQYGQTTEALAEVDWAQLAPVIDALSQPVRLDILRKVLGGVRTTAALLSSDDLGSTGQLHHHLRQLVAANWLVAVRRGEYAVPPQRVVPLLVTLMAAQR